MKSKRNPPLKRLFLLLIFSALATLGAACSDGSDAVEPLSLEQADLLANVQLKNFEAGATELVLTRHTELTDNQVVFEGSVDWENHQGSFEVIGDDDITGLAWTNQLMIERIPELNKQVNQILEEPIEWVFTEISNELNQEDAAAAYAIVSSLGSDTPDNAVLVRQNIGAGFVAETDSQLTLNFSNSSTFVIDKDTGLMDSFEFSNAEGDLLWSAEIVSRENVSVDIPDAVSPKSEIQKIVQQ